MATTLIFDGKKAVEPGIYTSVKSGFKNAPLSFPYGNVLILDTGSASGWGGAGVSGTNLSGANAVYEFTDLATFRSFIRGGRWWLDAEGLFAPYKTQPGASKVYWLSACATTPATITLGFGAGNVALATKREGSGSNGVLASSNLSKGFAATLSAGVIDPTKFIVKLWVGTYKGTHTDGTDIDGIADTAAAPLLLAQSPELSTLTDVVNWVNTDYNAGQYFQLTGTPGSGNIVAGDLVTMSGYVLAIGGTQTYNAGDVDAALTSIADLDYTFILSDKNGSNATNVVNTKIVTHLQSFAKYDKFLVIGGGVDKTTFTSQSIAAATTFNNQKVIVVHGGRKKTSNLSASGYRTFDALNKACCVLGRMAGLTPQTPLTFKLVDQDGDTHILTQGERELSLQKGVLVTKYDSDLKGWVILQGVNTLQANNYLVNNDGTSFSIAVNRIVAAVNRQIVTNAKIDLFGDQSSGPNYNTISPQDVAVWVRLQLESMKAQPGVDNLIKSYDPNVTVSVSQDSYIVNMRYTPNYEVNKILFVSFLLGA